MDRTAAHQYITIICIILLGIPIVTNAEFIKKNENGTYSQTVGDKTNTYSYALFSTQKIVAIIDSGMADATIPTIGGWSAIKNIPFSIDTLGHGTQLSRIVYDATGALIMPIKITDTANFIRIVDVLNGLVYVKNMKKKGYNIVAINMSFGGNTYSHYVEQELNELVDLGITPIAAAGNFREDTRIKPKYPAALANVISVGSVNAKSRMSEFSNWGGVDVAALGEYTFGKGTSYASAVVTSIVASMSNSPLVKKARLKKTAISNPEIEGLLGAGVVAKNATAYECSAKNDFDGDGVSDFVVWRPASGVFYINSSSRKLLSYQLGLSGDIPRIADYDGDGLADLAVWRPSDGNWYVRYSSEGYQYIRAIQWGLAGDIPL